MNVAKPLFLVLCLFVFSSAEAQKAAPGNWFTLDSKADGYNGVSSEKTYNTLLKGKKSKPIIVAVIDSGVDFNHEDLKDIMWVNPKEIPGNNKDDDQNGFIDDIHGWNFIGGKDGKNVGSDNLEVTRVYAKLRAKYKDRDPKTISKKEEKEYALYQETAKVVEEARAKSSESLEKMDMSVDMFYKAMDALEAKLGSTPLTAESIEKIDPTGDQNLMVGKSILTQMFEENSEEMPKSIKEIKEAIHDDFAEGQKYFKSQLEYTYNPDLNTRMIVGDNYSDSNEHLYGNSDCIGPDAFHGTHVAGIIAADRKNGKGIMGIADNVRIMSVRAVPDGDERDKDVANAIIYAVDNGASVINMSFGKGYSWDKAAVDRAVKYAAKHDVLLVHAAGNSGEDNDHSNNFPNDKFEKKGLFGKKTADNWLEIAALNWKTGEDIAANFSNYGQEGVDLFSPGVDLNSTVPNGGYDKASGTSMASPAAAGVAAILRSYFPNLTATQIKDIMMESVVPVDALVKKPGSGEKVPFKTLSVTGGTVNAYEAVKKAQTVKGKKKVENWDPTINNSPSPDGVRP
ncbi:MAG: S8 family serine peptidase [Saprospiraceae bacterium]